jgi:hypothetical protein
MRRTRKPLLSVVTMLAAGGACFQVGGCNLLGTAASALSTINPCGTLLVCDPAVYEFAMSGIDGPGVRPEIDPFCTFPPFCAADEDPIFGGISLFGP